jgi:hypothetical protein
VLTTGVVGIGAVASDVDGAHNPGNWVLHPAEPQLLQGAPLTYTGFPTTFGLVVK